MIFQAILSFAVTLSIGYAIVSLLWPEDRSPYQDLLIKSCLSVGCGFGISSCSYFLWVIFAGSYGLGFWTFRIFEIILLAAILAAIRVSRPKDRPISDAPHAQAHSEWTKTDIFCSLLLLTALILTLYSFIQITRIFPHGQWDAWGIWNRSARYLFGGVPSFHGEAGWKDFFLGSPSLPALDYPLLTPGIIARSWKYIGSQALLIPALTGAFFTFAAAGVLFSSLSILRSKTQGALATIFLFGTTAFTFHGASQYADVPLGFFIISTVTLFFLHDKIDSRRGRLLILAGLLAGFAMWTKNEGIVALIIIIITRAITIPFFKGVSDYLKELRLFGIGAIPGILVTLFFKLRYARPNPHLSETHAQLKVAITPITEKLTDLTRYKTIFAASKKHLLEFGSLFNIGTFYLSAIWILLAYIVISGVKIEKNETSNLITATLFAAGLSMAYFYIYVTSHYDLAWLLNTTYPRLFIQLWPTALFLFFILARDPLTK